MRLKFLFLLLISMLSISSFSQDVITKKDGTQINCKIIKEDSTRVYVIIGHFENKKDTSVEKSDIESISKKERPKPNGKFTDRNAVFRLDLLFPAISLESRTGNSATFLVSYEPGFAWMSSGNRSDNFLLLPKLKFALRKFVNIKDRMDNNKSTYKFAGTFISLNAFYIPENNYSNSEFILGPIIGLQRNFGNIVHFSIEIGSGFNFLSGSNRRISLLGDLKAGFSL